MVHGTTLSLLIPIFNEEENIQPLLESLVSVAWNLPVEFVFVDDHSRDLSLQKLRSWTATHQQELSDKQITVAIFEHTENRGKGAAIHTAISNACGEILIVQDADFEYNPHEIPGLIRPILQNQADVVYGSRFKSHSGQAHRTYHYLVNRILTGMSNLMSGLYLTDMETCYKAFRKDILKNIVLTSCRFGFEPEVTAHLARLRARVWELPISYYPRSYLEGKKITWKDGIAACWHILYYNWFVSYPQRFHATLPAHYVFKKWHERFTGISASQGKRLSEVTEDKPTLSS